jgi:hypothetical protein
VLITINVILGSVVNKHNDKNYNELSSRSKFLFTFYWTLNLAPHPAYFCGDSRGNQAMAGEARLAA